MVDRGEALIEGCKGRKAGCIDIIWHGKCQKMSPASEPYGFRSLACTLVVLSVFFLLFAMPTVKADAAVPYWNGGSGANFAPQPWPSDNQWIPYTINGSPIYDPRVQDPSNGGTRPQNYVNVSSGCPDESLPSVYFYYANNTLFFRFRVEQIPNNYATGPNPGQYSDVSPWWSAQWNVLFDTNGDGYRDFALRLNGASGMPSQPIDLLEVVHSDTLNQDLDPHDRGISLVASNPTGFVNDDSGLGTLGEILNFQSADNPVANWPNGSAETVWDYGTTRSIDITNYDPLIDITPHNPNPPDTTDPVETCGSYGLHEYYVDYQIPLPMIDAGTAQYDCAAPSAFLFATANSLNNPFQKDVVGGPTPYVPTPDECAAFGDQVVMCGPNDQPEIIPQPVVDSVSATADICDVTLQATVRGSMMPGTCTPNISHVYFYYYLDSNANGVADDGNNWMPVGGEATMSSADPADWTESWDASSLERGQYLIGVEAVNDAGNITWGFLTQAEVNSNSNVPTIGGPTPPNYANPVDSNDSTILGVVSNSVLLKQCGGTVTIDKSVNKTFTPVNQDVQFTLTVHNDSQSDMTVSSVTDYLPRVAGSSQSFTYVSTDGGTLSPGTPTVTGTSLTWDFSASPVTISAGGTGTIIFTAQAPGVSGTYSNTCDADVTAWGKARSISCNYAQVEVGAPDLTIAKSASVSTAAVGDPITYTITYSNDSPVSVTGAYITDVLPAGLTFVLAADGGTYDSASRTITWSIGDIQAGSGPFTVSFDATVTNPYPETSSVRLLNTATIASDETAPKNAGVTVAITGLQRPLLTIQKKGDKIFIDPTSNTASDRQVTYTIAFSNVGNSDATNTTITDAIPVGWTYDSSSAGTNCPAGTTTGNPVTSVTWNIGTLPVGTSGMCNLVLEAKDSSSQPYMGENPSTNTAYIQATGVSPVSSSYSVGLTGATMSCPGQTYYFHNQYLDPPADTMELANTTAPATSATAAYHHVSLTSNGCPNMSPVADFYQDPPLTNDGTTTPLTSQWYTEKTNGNPTDMVASVYDYDPSTGTEILLGSQTVKYKGADQSPYLNQITITPSQAPVAGHRLHWTYEACTEANNQILDLWYYYDGTLTDGNKTYYVPSHFCYQGSSVVLNKSVDKMSVVPGDTITYTINFGNNGGSDVTGSQIIDTMPEGLTFVSAALNGTDITSSCSLAGQVLTCAVNSNDNPGSGTITTGQQGTLVVTADVANPFPSGLYELVNTSELTTDQTQPVYSSATSEVATSVTIMKSVDKSILYPGDTATYTLAILNSSGAPITVNVTDALPEDTYYTYISNSASNGGSYSGGTITWSSLTVPADSSVSLTFQMAVSLTGVPLGTTYKDNTGVVTDGMQQYSNTVRVAIVNGPRLDITKTVDKSTAAAGDTATYSMTVTNVGSQDAFDVLVTDPVPGYESYKGGTIYYDGILQTDAQYDAGGSVDDNAYFDAPENRIVYNVGTLTSGQSHAMSFQVVIDKPMPDGTTTVTNTATASSSNTASKQASATLNVTDQPTLTLDKYGPDLVASGQNFTFMLYYQNTGGATATNVVVTDVLPSGLNFVSADNGGTYDSGTGTVTWNLGSIDPGVGGALHVTVSSTTCGTYNNTGVITSTEVPAPGVSSNTTTTVVCGLVPDKSTSTPNVTNSTTGTTATYTITVSNPTATTATGVQITDDLSAGFTYDSTVSETPQSDGSVTPATGAQFPTWGNWDIAPGGSVSITFNAHVAGNVPAGTYQNGVTAVSSNDQVLPFDELATTADDVTVSVPVDLSVTKTVSNSTPSNTVPDNFIYTISLTNVGVNHAFRVNLSDLLPAGITYVSSNASQGTFDNISGDWDVGTVDRGANATLTITAYPNTGTAGETIQNCASLTSSIPADINAANNQSCATIVPTVVSLTGFTAYVEGGKVVVEWNTEAERNTVGFYVYRYDASTDQYIRVDKNLLPSMLTSETGGTYRLIDQSAVPSGKQLYKLVEVQNSGGTLVYGPFSEDLGSSGAPDVVKRFAADGTVEITIKGGATVVRKTTSSSDAGFQNVTGTFSRKPHGMSAITASRLAAGQLEETKAQGRDQNRKGSALKISVPNDGVYYLDASDISTRLGVPLQSVKELIKDGNVSLSCGGKQVSYAPAEGDAGLYFFGQGIKSVYTNDNIYWLNLTKGVLMDSVDDGAASFAGPVKDSFGETLHFEKNLMPAPNLTEDPNSDYWYWDYVTAGESGLDTKDFHFSTDSVSPASDTATVTVHLQGITDTSANPDHHVLLSLNGKTIGQGKWDGINPYTISANIDQSLLNSGDNTLEVKGVLDPGVDYSLFFINSFDVSYSRLYQAVNDYLSFKAGGNSSITVGGFSTSSITVFNVTDPLNPKVVSSASISGQAGNYSVQFYPGSADSAYVAFASDAAVNASDIAALPSADLKDKNNAADYVVIAPEELKSAALQLALYRQSKNMRTLVVPLENIMDEFNYGISDPNAIKSFLKYAYDNWRKKPSYAVLLGNGTYDYKNILGYGGNLVPPLMVGTPMGLMPSDNVLGDFTGDNVPEIAIGRIPVMTSAELGPVLDKIKSFETDRVNGSLMLADVPDGAGNFPQDSDDIASFFPSSYPVQKVYLSNYPVTQARAMLFQDLDWGVSFVNYFGHASYDQLSDQGLLTSDDVSGLNNTAYPVMTAMTCSAGNFSLPGYDSLMGLLLLQKGGGIASSWSPSGWSYNGNAKVLDKDFYTAVFHSDASTLGDAVISSMSAYARTGISPFMLNVMNILGDPAMKLR